MQRDLADLLRQPVQSRGNLLTLEDGSSATLAPNQQQTNNAFSDKWTKTSGVQEIDRLYQFQFDWFLSLYGFESEDELARFLQQKPVIIDTGCGLGYKAAWFARLAPNSRVLGLDLSEAVDIAAQTYAQQDNLTFIKCDIANTPLLENSVDFVVCDQVLQHTECPEKTFAHLASLVRPGGEFACYVYRKKALPRELLDDHFRERTHSIDEQTMWEFSRQITELGKRLSELNVKFECPDIPLLGIEGGEYDIQRFLYWNFLKCFWREDWGFDLSTSTNYDWYAPSNAKRFSEQEFRDMVSASNLSTVYFHQEEACYSGRFGK